MQIKNYQKSSQIYASKYPFHITIHDIMCRLAGGITEDCRVFKGQCYTT